MLAATLTGEFADADVIPIVQGAYLLLVSY